MNIDIDIEIEIIHLGTTVKLYWGKLAENLDITEFKLVNELGYYLLERETISLDSPTERCTYITGDVDDILSMTADFIGQVCIQSICN